MQISRSSCEYRREPRGDERLEERAHRQALAPEPHEQPNPGADDDAE